MNANIFGWWIRGDRILHGNLIILTGKLRNKPINIDYHKSNQNRGAGCEVSKKTRSDNYILEYVHHEHQKPRNRVQLREISPSARVTDINKTTLHNIKYRAGYRYSYRITATALNDDFIGIDT